MMGEMEESIMEQLRALSELKIILIIKDAQGAVAETMNLTIYSFVRRWRSTSGLGWVKRILTQQSVKIMTYIRKISPSMMLDSCYDKVECPGDRLSPLSSEKMANTMRSR